MGQRRDREEPVVSKRGKGRGVIAIALFQLAVAQERIAAAEEALVRGRIEFRPATTPACDWAESGIHDPWCSNAVNGKD